MAYTNSKSLWLLHANTLTKFFFLENKKIQALVAWIMRVECWKYNFGHAENCWNVLCFVDWRSSFGFRPIEFHEDFVIATFDVTFSMLFGCKEVGGSKEIGKYNCSLSYLSKHRKRKIRKSFFLFSFLFYTIISSLPECYS